MSDTPTPTPPENPLWKNSPPWFVHALAELGVHETGNNAGPNVARYIQMAKCGAIGDPWCAIFVNAMLESNGVPGTRSPSSRSFIGHPDFVAIPKPCMGAIAVFWRGASPRDGHGHVGFYRGELADHVYVLGGNEGDMVQIEPFPRISGTFGLIGYVWPRTYPVPINLGAVTMPAGTPVHQTMPIKVT